MALNATNHFSLLSEIIIKAWRRYETRIPVDHMVNLLCTENDTMIEELLVLPFLPCDTLQSISQYLSIKVQKLITTYVGKSSKC